MEKDVARGRPYSASRPFIQNPSASQKTPPQKTPLKVGKRGTNLGKMGPHSMSHRQELLRRCVRRHMEGVLEGVLRGGVKDMLRVSYRHLDVHRQDRPCIKPVVNVLLMCY